MSAKCIMCGKSSTDNVMHFYSFVADTQKDAPATYFWVCRSSKCGRVLSDGMAVEWQLLRGKP